MVNSKYISQVLILVYYRQTAHEHTVIKYMCMEYTGKKGRASDGMGNPEEISIVV